VNGVVPTEANGGLTWTFEDVAVGAKVSVSFKVTVLESAVAEGTVANSAAIEVGSNKYNSNITTNSVVGKQAVNVPAEGLKVGDAVVKNQTLATIEAMKMETAVTARMDGVVASIEIKEGDTVKGGQLLMTIK
jgi:biotin carboxyl carrier protein